LVRDLLCSIVKGLAWAVSGATFTVIVVGLASAMNMRHESRSKRKANRLDRAEPMIREGKEKENHE
jgi:hypothetical protein